MRYNKLNAELRLSIENNSSHVRGIKRTIEMIEFFILSDFGFQKDPKNCYIYNLEIPYESNESLEETVKDIINQIHNKAESNNTFMVDIQIKEISNEERCWD